MMSAIADAFPIARGVIDSRLAWWRNRRNDPTEPAVQALLLDPVGRDQRTRAVQPALFLCQVACLEVLRSFGVEPTASIGHPVGEIAPLRREHSVERRRATRARPRTAPCRGQAEGGMLS